MKQLLFVWIAILILAACSNSADSQSNSYVSGSWVASCIIRNGSVVIETQTFSDNIKSTSTVVYFDSTCPAENGETATYESESNYILGKELITAGGNSAREIDVDVYFDGEFSYTQKNIVSIVNGILYFGWHFPSSVCDPDELIYLGPTVGDFCNERPTMLNFEEPYNQKI